MGVWGEIWVSSSRFRVLEAQVSVVCTPGDWLSRRGLVSPLLSGATSVSPNPLMAVPPCRLAALPPCRLAGIGILAFSHSGAKKKRALSALGSSPHFPPLRDYKLGDPPAKCGFSFPSQSTVCNSTHSLPNLFPSTLAVISLPSYPFPPLQIQYINMREIVHLQTGQCGNQVGFGFRLVFV